MSYVVIGGGLAGLSAALTLQEAGESVELYEASFKRVWDALVDTVGKRVRGAPPIAKCITLLHKKTPFLPLYGTGSVEEQAAAADAQIEAMRFGQVQVGWFSAVPALEAVRRSNAEVLGRIVDSGGTLCNAAEALLARGAKDVRAYITHGVLSGGAVARISSSKLKELVVTDSIQPTEAVRVASNIRVISIAPLLGEAIGRTAKEESVSSLFD